MTKVNWLISGILLVAIAAITLVAGLWTQRQTEEIRNPYVNVGGEFTLFSKDGPVSLSDYRGKVVLLFFGYTLCPDVCPTDLARMGAVFRELSVHEANKVRGIFVSVDPERDTISKVTKYAAFFHENIIGLTGSANEVGAVAKQYFVLYQKVDNDDLILGYTIDHSAITYLIGRNGQVVELIRHGTTIEEIVQSIHATLDG